MMQLEIGDPHFAIWLLGDSNPRNWENVLETPLDPRHPARHNIWTSIVDVMQDYFFRNAKLRMDTSNIYIRNAIQYPKQKPRPNIDDWPKQIDNQLIEFRDAFSKYSPKLIFSFGAFSFEFARRALNEQPQKPFGLWGAKRLGCEFRHRLGNFSSTTITLIPLLHISIQVVNLSRVTNISVIGLAQTTFNFLVMQSPA